MELGLPPFPGLGAGRRFRAYVQRLVQRARHAGGDDRRHHRQGSPRRSRRKRGTLNQAIGKSKGGWTTKILALTDALGRLVRFVLLPGNRYDTVGVAPLIRGLRFEALLADKAFDAGWIIEELNERGAVVCISQRPNRTAPLEIDAELYKRRHLIENFFCDLKDFRRIATRSDKTDTSFTAMINACAALLNTR